MVRSRLLFAVSTALSLVACQSAPKSNGTATTTSKVEIQPVEWPKQSIDAQALARLPSASQTAVAKSTVPVLVPADPALLAVAVVMVEEVWTAVSASGGGVTIAIHCTRLAHKYEGQPPIAGDRDVRGTKGFVTQNESIRSASWNEHGVGYSLDVECADPTEARCGDDKYLLSVVEGLRYVGGGAQ